MKHRYIQSINSKGCSLYCMSNLFAYPFIDLMKENPELGEINEMQENKILQAQFPHLFISEVFKSHTSIRPMMKSQFIGLIRHLQAKHGNDDDYMVASVTTGKRILHCVYLTITKSSFSISDPFEQSPKTWEHSGDKYSRYHYDAWDYIKRHYGKVHRVGLYCTIHENDELCPAYFN